MEVGSNEVWDIAITGTSEDNAPSSSLRHNVFYEKVTFEDHIADSLKNQLSVKKRN